MQGGRWRECLVCSRGMAAFDVMSMFGGVDVGVVGGTLHSGGFVAGLSGCSKISHDLLMGAMMF